MTDLANFLLARIAEDEAAARAVVATPIETVGGYWETRNADYGEIALAVDPARVLAECEAKRRIVERWRVCEPNYDEGNRLETRVLDWTMRLLALPHADHPDYRQEWRP